VRHIDKRTTVRYAAIKRIEDAKAAKFRQGLKNMPSHITATYKDRKGETATFRMRIRDILAANLDAVEDEFAALRTALEPYTLGNLQNWKIEESVEVSDGAASSPAARREDKLLLFLEDAVTHDTYQHEIPCANFIDETLFISTGKKTTMIEDGAEWDALVAAIEGGKVRSKAGNAVLLRGGEVVGRNL
jgi:hypothetical protein